MNGLFLCVNKIMQRKSPNKGSAKGCNLSEAICARIFASQMAVLAAIYTERLLKRCLGCEAGRQADMHRKGLNQTHGKLQTLMTSDHSVNEAS